MYSYEQFICAILANYKRTIPLGEINKVILAYKENRPNFGLIAQRILYIGPYIGYSKNSVWLNSDLEDNVNYNGQNMSIRDFFNMIAGEELVSFIKEYIIEENIKHN